MPEFGGIRPWEMGGFTPAEAEMLGKSLDSFESEMAKAKRAAK